MWKACSPFGLRPSIRDQTICQIFMKFGVGVLYKKLSCKGEFGENQHSKRHTLLQGMNEILPIFSTFLIQFG